MTDEELMRHMRENTPLNQLRATLSGIIGAHEQAGMQRRMPSPAETRKQEFADVLRLVAKAHELGLTPGERLIAAATEARDLLAARVTVAGRSMTVAELIAAHERAVREADAGPWRLLSHGEVIEAGDQGLQDDCVTWRDLVGWEIGMIYNSVALVPMRRRAPPETEGA